MPACIKIDSLTQAYTFLVGIPPVSDIASTHKTPQPVVHGLFKAAARHAQLEGTADAAREACHDRKNRL
ncbi:hypothetical protein [Desulfovibrio sp. 86]|uniref:hypothetical protein n=1 Tax=Desulfovibrio sp. 86 TaxID=2666132 RepID=UPI0015D1D876|nr:hypothetical protein [Desulfovibrio sp. 86]